MTQIEEVDRLPAKNFLEKKAKRNKLWVLERRFQTLSFDNFDLPEDVNLTENLARSKEMNIDKKQI